MKQPSGWLKLRLFLTYPDVVEVSDDLLEFNWDVKVMFIAFIACLICYARLFYVNINVGVLIKAGLHRTELRQGPEVVGVRFK